MTELTILNQYFSIFVLLNFGVITVVGFVILNKLLAPKRDTSNQIEGLSSFIAYECGEVPIGEAQARFNFQYYVFALVFVIFDVVTSILIAWALSLQHIDSVSNSGVIASAGLFIGILLVGFFYWWRRKALRWM